MPTGFFALNDPTLKGACFSEDRIYRYALWRIWSKGLPKLLVVGLNPSIADETTDDHTIKRCLGFAASWGFGGLIMTNVFAYRETDPMKMMEATDPVGPMNEVWLRHYNDKVSFVLAAWGQHCPPRKAEEVCCLLNRPLHCLGKTKNGSPKHPLRIAANTKPTLFWEPTKCPPVSSPPAT